MEGDGIGALLDLFFHGFASLRDFGMKEWEVGYSNPRQNVLWTIIQMTIDAMG